MDILQSLFSNVWSAFLVVLFLGGSIFVHELGHFLAARRRGVHVERFSIGFGPKLFAWRGRDGVEYRLSWLPLGGYVALPQLADMRGIEGESHIDTAKLPPPSYSTKILVFIAGAVFNVIFAFLLATVLWAIGQRVAEEEQTTRVGVVLPTMELPTGATVPGPAFTAGVRPGDVVLAVDGKKVSSFSEISYLVALGSGRGANNEPKADLTIQRDGQTLQLAVSPVRYGDELIRGIGIEPTAKVMIAEVIKGSAAETAGIVPGDQVLTVDGQPANYVSFLSEHLRKTGGKAVELQVQRGEEKKTLTVTPRQQVDPQTQATVYRVGVALREAVTLKLAHIPPWQQLKSHAIMTWRTLVSLISPRSDIGLSKMSGPIGIADRIHTFAQFDFRLVLAFVVLINVNLALFNLLPIPVLDGGHILFATIGRLRGRALPMDFIATTQSVFFVILFSMILYVSFFDVRRLVRENRPEKPAPAAPANTTPPPAPAATPAPAK